MSITAAQVKALRQATGAGMMDCKKALVKCDGDLEEAATYLKKKGIADSQKRADRTASEGTIVARVLEGGTAVLLEVNCETDFVARNDDFVGFVNGLCDHAIALGANTVGDLLGSDWDGVQTSERVLEQSGKIGEKIVVANLEWISLGGKPGTIGTYIHDGGKIGTVVAVAAASADDVQVDAFGALAKDLSMHVAASDPAALSSDDLDPAVVAKEHEIFLARTIEEGKPEEIAKKIVMGRMAKWKKEVVLLDQPFVKEPKVSVANHVKAVSKEHFSGAATVVAFARLRLGSGGAA